MTRLACDAAAIELETYAKELLATAATLRRFASTMAGEPTVKATAILDFTETVKPDQQARPPKAQRASQRPVAPRSSKAAPTPRGNKYLAVRDALSTEERTLREIVTRAAVSRTAVLHALEKMLTAKHVVKRREGHAMLYRLVAPGEGSTPRRSGPAAGTPAGSAGGSVPGRRLDASEVVWNGTLERNGQAPSILPPRERKP